MCVSTALPADGVNSTLTAEVRPTALIPDPLAKWSRYSPATRCFTATVGTADFLFTARMCPFIYQRLR